MKTDKCSGCSACYNICPVNAIKMEEDIEGFKYPVIDKTLCTNCGLCEKVCNSDKFINKKNPACYAFMAEDKIRSKSASGGVFPVLAYHFIKNGGYVCGAIFDNDWSVKHIVSDKPEDIEKMRSSKYLQSDIGNCYKEIKKLLDKNISVLFTGTPCQVSGLKSFLQKDYDNLFCLDLICHGVPSAKIFKKHLKENFDNITDINFRDKSKDGWGIVLSITHNQQKSYYDDNDYYTLFLKNATLRKNCYECEYNKLPRQGDMTIGDFWGIEKYSKKINDKLGTSVILINNAKGKNLLKILQQNAKLCKKVPIRYAKRRNRDIYAPSIPHPNRNKLNVDKLSINENRRLILDDKCDCMILNFWYSVNYGAALTAYGVICLLKKLGINAKTINYGHDKYTGTFSENFGKKYLNLTNLCKSYDDFLDLNNNCKTFIVGSDQVWNDVITQFRIPKIPCSIYYLNFVKNNAKRLSYAASFGAYKFESSNEYREIFQHLINQFDAVSVREHFGKDILKNEFNINSTQLIDGAFHIPMNELIKMTDQYPALNEKYIAYFQLPYYKARKSEYNIVLEISKKLQIPLKKINFDSEMPVEQWLSIIKNAEFIISDSYHATVFSIIFNKPFVQIIHANSQDRFDSLFKLLETENNSIGQYETDLNFDKIFVKRDWEKINKIIAREVKRAEEWMQQAINMPVKDKINYDIENFMIAQSLLDKEKLLICTNKTKFITKYTKYKILSNILFGKKRQYYKNKGIKFKQYMDIIKHAK